MAVRLFLSPMLEVQVTRPVFILVSSRTTCRVAGTHKNIDYAPRRNTATSPLLLLFFFSYTFQAHRNVLNYSQAQLASI